MELKLFFICVACVKILSFVYVEALLDTGRGRGLCICRCCSFQISLVVLSLGQAAVVTHDMLGWH